MRAVLADSTPLAFPADSHALNETLGARPDAAHIDWQLYRPKYGNSVEISSGVLPRPCPLPKTNICMRQNLSSLPGDGGK